MAKARRVVDALLDSARAPHGSDAAKIVLLSAAATVSRRRHTGWFTNPTLESQLCQLGERLRPMWTVSERPDRARTLPTAKSRVLHIMTRGYAAGGHTRLVQRWIHGEPTAVSSVAFTQGCGDEPAELFAAAVRSGGGMHRLQGSPIERVRQLQTLARASSHIVLSIHENDVVALLAIAGLEPRPPVISLNHAEHVFWAGASLAEVVVSLRPASTDLAVRRRGVPLSRCVEIPLPVSAHRRIYHATEARRMLGIAPDHKVLLTVGWGYKFTPLSGDDIFCALAPILEDADVHLVAVGPTDGEELWSTARARYGGRVHAAGRQDDMQPFLDAADVFVDSYPIASLTAALEAAMSGLPVVGLAPRHAAWPGVLREDDPALADEIFDDVDAYRHRIRTLLRDPDAFRSASRSIRQLVARTHGPEAWTSAMQRVREAVAFAERDRQQLHQQQLGTPGAEDDVLATYVADCEDRLIRPELRLNGVALGSADPHLAEINRRIERIDELLLQPASPSNADYEEALQLARDSIPRPAVSGAVRAGVYGWGTSVLRRGRARN